MTVLEWRMVVSGKDSQIVQPRNGGNLCIGARDGATFGLQLGLDTSIFLGRHHVKVQERYMIQQVLDAPQVLCLTTARVSSEIQLARHRDTDEEAIVGLSMTHK